MKQRGKLIVIYGANNLGKSVQTDLLLQSLQGKRLQVKKIKYPIYNLEPTGPLINAVLRKGKKLPERTVQKLYAQNRRDYEPIIKEALSDGTWIIAEDYTGTGLVWGMVRGLDLKFLEEINNGLYPEDMAFVLYGKRFISGKELDHRNETDDTLWQKAHDLHLRLADRYGWMKIYANQPPKQVHADILSHLSHARFSS